jgi:hypothetical protein
MPSSYFGVPSQGIAGHLVLGVKQTTGEFILRFPGGSVSTPAVVNDAETPVCNDSEMNRQMSTPTNFFDNSNPVIHRQWTEARENATKTEGEVVTPHTR